MKFFNVAILFLFFSILTISCTKEPGVTPLDPQKPFDHIIDEGHEQWKTIHEHNHPGEFEEYVGDGQLLGYDRDRIAFHISAETLVSKKKFNYTFSNAIDGGSLVEYQYPIEKDVGEDFYPPYHQFLFHKKEEEEIILVGGNKYFGRVTPSTYQSYQFNSPIDYSIVKNSVDVLSTRMENHAITRDMDFTSFNITGEKGIEKRPSIFIQNGNLLGDTVVLYGDSQLRKEMDDDSYLDDFNDPSCAINMSDIGWMYFVFYEDCYLCETETMWKLGVFTLEDKQVVKGYEDDNISLEGIMTANLIKEVDLENINDHHDPHFFSNFTTARVKQVNENELLILFHLGPYYSLFRYYVDSQSLTDEFSNVLLPEYAGPNFVDFSIFGALYFGYYERLYVYRSGQISVLYDMGRTFDSESPLIDFIVTKDRIIGMFHKEYTVENANIEGSISKTFGIAIGSRSVY